MQLYHLSFSNNLAIGLKTCLHFYFGYIRWRVNLVNEIMLCGIYMDFVWGGGGYW